MASSTPEGRSFVLRDDAGAVGDAVLTGTVPVLKLERLSVRAGSDARTVGALVRARATSSGARVLTLEVPQADPVLTAVAAGSRVLGEHLEKQLTDTPVAPTGIGWRPMTEAELGPWHDRQLRAYAEDNLDRSGGDLELALERSRRDFDRLLPDGLHTADTSLVVLHVDGEPVGHLWLRHHQAPGASFVYDVEVAQEHRGHGYGRAAMLVAEVLSQEAGDDVLGLHVFGPNTVARNLYLSLGYRVLSTTHDLLAPASEP